MPIRQCIMCLRPRPTREFWKDSYGEFFHEYCKRCRQVDYRYRTLAGKNYVEFVNRRVVWGRDEGHCRVKLVCDGDFVPYHEMVLEHRIPLSMGGEHSYANVQTSRFRCNCSKGNRV